MNIIRQGETEWGNTYRKQEDEVNVAQKCYLLIVAVSNAVKAECSGVMSDLGNLHSGCEALANFLQVMLRKVVVTSLNQNFQCCAFTTDPVR